MDDQEEEGDVPKSAVSSGSFSTNGSGTSSEEEHREDAAEIAAIVEELVPDEDPVHISSDDMKLLIEKVKRFTTISNVGEDDWNDDVCEVIHQFFSHRKNKLLAVYFNKKTLEARLDIPKIAVTDIMVFLKDPADEITPENFHDTIKFTTCSGMVEGTILSLTQYIYTPALFKSKSLPEGTRDEFLLKMYSFLSDLTDINSKLQGYTSIYVPIGALSYSIDQGSENKDLIKRLERMEPSSPGPTIILSNRAFAAACLASFLDLPAPIARTDKQTSEHQNQTSHATIKVSKQTSEAAITNHQNQTSQATITGLKSNIIVTVIEHQNQKEHVITSTSTFTVQRIH